LENKGLLFIPDISGFTQFVNKSEISHSRLIVQELLEILINANQLGLEVSEVEGDAILFYKFGESPELEDIYKQVEKMFREFHKHLLAYGQHRYCQCAGCVAASNLSLKVITHYGEFTGYNVKQFNKLIGKDVIVAHQLLKNDIDQHEYWLVTSNLLQNNVLSGFADWMRWDSSVKQTESGEIPFHYTQLSELRNKLEPQEPLQLEIPEKTKIFSFSREFETDIITLFHATGSFNYRQKWLEGVKKIEAFDDHLPRVGMKCLCVLDNEEDVFCSSSYSYTEERIEFSETDEKKRSATYFLLEKISDSKTKLTMDFYLKKSIILQLLFNLLKRKRMEQIFSKSMQNLVDVVKEVKLTT
jgi:hypothetical protein